jgi:hypothetical protein
MIAGCGCIGAWYEWELHEIDMAVPLSPNEVPEKKRYFLPSVSKGQSDVPRE